MKVFNHRFSFFFYLDQTYFQLEINNLLSTIIVSCDFPRETELVLEWKVLGSNFIDFFHLPAKSLHDMFKRW